MDTMTPLNALQDLVDRLHRTPQTDASDIADVVAHARTALDIAVRNAIPAAHYLDQPIRSLERAGTIKEIENRWRGLRRAAEAALAAVSKASSTSLCTEIAFLSREAMAQVRAAAGEDVDKAEEARKHLEQASALQVELMKQLMEPELRIWNAQKKGRAKG